MHRQSKLLLSIVRVGAAAVVLLPSFIVTSAAPPDILIRFLDANSGKPLAGIHLAVIGWNADDFHSEAEKVVFKASIRTDKNGTVTVHLLDPPPKHLAISNPNEIHGCSVSEFAVEDALRTGIVAQYKKKCGQQVQVVPAKPGEVIVYEKKFTWWDWIKQETPH